MDDVTIYGFSGSTFVRTARLICAEKEIPHTLAPLEVRDDSHRALHPYLRMPVMRHGQLELFETLAIATYLNDEFPGRDLESAPGAERARMFQWVSVSSDYLYNGLVRPLVASSTIRVEEARMLLAPIDRALSLSPFLAGGELSLADLFLLPIVLFAETALNDDLLLPLRNLREWRIQLGQRPSVRQTEV